MTFIQLYKSIDLSQEFKKYKEIYVNYTPNQKIVLLLMALKNTFFGKSPKSSSVEYIFNCSNMTKFSCFKPYYDRCSNKKVLINNDEGVRTTSFINQLKKEEINYQLSLKGNFEIQIFPTLLNHLLDLDFCRLFFTIESYFLLNRYYSIFESAKPKALITANEDSILSTAITKLCRSLSIKTINIMHGRAYLNDQIYDYSIVYGHSQKTFLINNTESNTHFLVAKSPFEIKSVDKPATEDPTKISILFCDQYAFDLYPLSVRDRIILFLKNYFSNNPRFQLEVQPHPSQNWSENILSTSFKKGNLSSYKYDLTISTCSTVGLESVLCFNTPTIFLNFDKVTLNFSQTLPLIDYFIGNEQELTQFLAVLNNDTLSDIFNKQNKTLEAELLTGLDYDTVFTQAFC